MKIYLIDILTNNLSIEKFSIFCATDRVLINKHKYTYAHEDAYVCTEWSKRLYNIDSCEILHWSPVSLDSAPHFVETQYNYK